MYRDPKELLEETNQAKSCPFSLIANYFGYELETKGNHLYFSSAKNIAIFTETNSYYDYYDRVGGSPIDFVMREKNMSIGEAIRFINSNILGHSVDITGVNNYKCNNNKISADFKLPNRADTHRRVYAYLTKSRGISDSVVKYCLHNNLIYEEATHHNAVFVCYDSTHVAKHAFLRGTVSDVVFRGDVAGSNKDYGFVIKPELPSNTLIVFEAPIDLLSYMSFFPKINDNLIAIGMLDDAPIDKFLESNTNIKTIQFLTDNDEPGKNFRTSAVAKYSELGYSIETSPVQTEMEKRGVKDINELLMVARIEMAKIKSGGSR